MIITPTLNEAAALPAFADHLKQMGIQPSQVTVVDGGSRDGTAEVAGSLGFRVAEQKGGLAAQLNRGIAMNPKAEIYWFLPVDIAPARNAREQIEKLLEDPSVVAGGFRLKFHSGRLAYRVIEAGARLRSPRGRLVLGDQGLFVRGEPLRRVAGFDENTLIPHWDLCRRLLHLGRIITLPEVALASPSGYERHGVWRTWWKHQRITMQFLREG